MKHFTLSVAALLCMGATAYAQRFAPAKAQPQVLTEKANAKFLPEFKATFAWDAELEEFVPYNTERYTYNEDGSVATMHETSPTVDFLHLYKYDDYGYQVEDLYQYEKVAGQGYVDYARVRAEYDHNHGHIQLSQEAARAFNNDWQTQGMSTWERLVERNDRDQLLSYTQNLFWLTPMDPTGSWYIMERTLNQYDEEGNQTRYTFQTQNGYEEGTTDYSDISKIIWLTHYDVKTTAWDRNNGNVTARNWITTQHRGWEELFTGENRLLSGVTVNENGEDYVNFKATYTGEDYSIDYVYPVEWYEGVEYPAEIDRFSRETSEDKVVYRVEAWQDMDKDESFSIFAGSSEEIYNYDKFGLLVDYSYYYTDPYEVRKFEDGVRVTITYDENTGLPETALTEKYDFKNDVWVNNNIVYYNEELVSGIDNAKVEANVLQQPSNRFFDLMGRRASSTFKGSILIDQNGKKFIK